MQWQDFTLFLAAGKSFGMCGGMAKVNSSLGRDELACAGLE
jgi:hypothetical protein